MSNLHDAIWKQSGIRANSCCGSYSYAVPWSTVQRICKRSDCTYPWLQHARMEILDVQACDCQHEPQKPCLVVSFDCYFPRLPEERASSTEYGCVKNWLSSNGQNVSCRLCSQCTGYEFNGQLLTTDGIADMLMVQTRWDRWWYLSSTTIDPIWSVHCRLAMKWIFHRQHPVDWNILWYTPMRADMNFRSNLDTQRSLWKTTGVPERISHSRRLRESFWNPRNFTQHFGSFLSYTSCSWSFTCRLGLQATNLQKSNVGRSSAP